MASLDIELIKLPKSLPKTQSSFYMPLLSEAYLIVKKKEIPEGLVKQINYIKQLPLLTEERYKKFLEGIIYKLKKYPELIDLMTRSYQNIDNKGDKYSREPIDNAGHIRGDIQEIILYNSYVGKNLEEFSTDGFPETRKIKELFDHIIIMNYISNKYLKYKIKYLKLKNKLKK